MRNPSSFSTIAQVNGDAVGASNTTFPPAVVPSGRCVLPHSRVLPKLLHNMAEHLRMTWAYVSTRAWRFRCQAVVLCWEGTLTSLGYAFSTSLLSDVYGAKWASQILPRTLLWLVSVRILSFLFFGTCKLSLRVASIPELICITKAVSSSSLAFCAISRLAVRDTRLPAALFILDWTVSIFLLVGLHFGLRLYKAQRAIGRSGGKRALIIGAGDAGTKVLKELVLDSGSAVLPVGIIDDDPQKRGTTICGVPVLGGLSDLASVVREQEVEEVFICIPSATRSQMKLILEACRECGIPVRTLPSLAELVDGIVGPQDLRSVRIDDLLQREEVKADAAFVREVIGDRVVLVTGAGGSIGSELCRQIASGSPRKLILLERSENSLFYINLELQDRFPSLCIEPRLVDVTCRDRVRAIFESERPEIIFHAAAHKHVHLMELHPYEAVRNNVLGTRNTAVAARDFGANRFVNVSTDKAVKPRNYMGLSKKITELVVRELAESSQTRFMSVRFGNVAGSTGSVLRLFRDQIQKGGPIRITDPRATRYFMTIAEAVCLILHAAAQGQGGETFVFDMGKPLNIYEIARAFSLFSGLTPGKDLLFEFIGLKEGEKIAEELWESWEALKPTTHDRIFEVSDGGRVATRILEQVDEFERLLTRGDYEGLLVRCHKLFPEFAIDHGLHITRPDKKTSTPTFYEGRLPHERAAFLS
jgi:FlaA1/EpsC-like NDP-sugar epimerase